jgi:hypothetical protein
MVIYMGKQVSIGVQQELKTKLDNLRTHPRDSYGDIIGKLIQEHEQRVEPTIVVNSENSTIA